MIDLIELSKNTLRMQALKDEPGAVPLRDWLMSVGYKDETLQAMCETHVAPITHATPATWSALTYGFFNVQK